ncbi:MAG: hypothetical protein IKP76_02060 [Bacilli bacterium]|nr:hypothetical protein [Bacilli bacterium]
MKKILLSLSIMALSIFMIGNIYHENNKTTIIEFDNKTYLDANYMRTSIVNQIVESDIMIYEIADDIKTTNDTSNYVFIALLVGVLGFVITRFYLKHIN